MSYDSTTVRSGEQSERSVYLVVLLTAKHKEGLSITADDIIKEKEEGEERSERE
jgi:hypothetical protein